MEDQNDDAALAGEYVLHLLEDAERAAFEARLDREPALRDLVRDWDEHLAGLADDVAPVAPPDRVKAALHQTLFPEPPEHAGPARALRRWLIGGLAVAALAVGAVLLTPDLLRDVAPEPTLAASVAAEDGTLVVTARFVAATNTLGLVREAGAARPGRVLELWLIADGADAPVSLGVLPETAETQVALAPDLAARLVGGVLAISDEPPGGSPTGAPTGDVLAVGPVTAL